MARLFSLLALCFVTQLSAGLNLAHKVKNPKEQKRIVVITNAFNNEAYCEKNLDSIFSQDYENFHVIYTDDASTDKTYKIVHQYIEDRDLWDKITLFRNKKNHKIMYNHYRAIHMCDDDDIVVVVDADDWLPNKHILSDVNRYHANPDVWVTTGNFIIYPENRKSSSFHPMERRYLEGGLFRKELWSFSHLKTFYAGLFKQIRLEDFFHRGNFIPVCCDLAMMYPIAEQAREHLYFVDEIRYIYNMETPLCNDYLRPSLQKTMDKYIRSLRPYSKVAKREDLGSQKTPVDALLFSYNRPMELYAALESVQDQSEGVRSIYVLYRSDDPYKEAYEVVKEDFSNVTFIEQSVDEDVYYASFAPMLKALFDTMNRRNQKLHLLVGTDQSVLQEGIEFSALSSTLNQTGAFAYYLSMEKGSSGAFVEVNDNLCIWDFAFHKMAERKSPYSLDYTLFDQLALKQMLAQISPIDPEDIGDLLARKQPPKKLGLIPKESKIYTLKHGLDPKLESEYLGTLSSYELSRLLVAGYKINLSQLSKKTALGENIELTSRLEYPPLLAKK